MVNTLVLATRLLGCHGVCVPVCGPLYFAAAVTLLAIQFFPAAVPLPGALCTLGYCGWTLRTVCCGCVLLLVSVVLVTRSAGCCFAPSTLSSVHFLWDVVAPAFVYTQGVAACCWPAYGTGRGMLLVPGVVCFARGPVCSAAVTCRGLGVRFAAVTSELPVSSFHGVTVCTGASYILWTRSAVFSLYCGHSHLFVTCLVPSLTYDSALRVTHEVCFCFGRLLPRLYLYWLIYSYVLGRFLRDRGDFPFLMYFTGFCLFY